MSVTHSTFFGFEGDTAIGINHTDFKIHRKPSVT